MPKLIVVLGGTGNQGSSVIETFLKDPQWKVRTVNRDPSKAACKALKQKGVEVVKGSFDDVDSLIAAFRGANVVFGVTDFWAPFFDPKVHESLAPGQLINQYCYDVELQQGKIIADAVATIADTTLEHYIWSSLSDVKKWSKGKYTWVYHFDSKAHVYDYIKEKLPKLAKKTSSVQMGLYADNWKKSRAFLWLNKADDGVFEETNCTEPQTIIPWVDTLNDTGKFVKSLTRTDPGKDLLGVSEEVTIEVYLKQWSEILGLPARHKTISVEEYEEKLPDTMKKELSESAAYNAEYGWDGGEGILLPKDVGTFVGAVAVRVGRYSS
ncbi:hypothetical protein INT43_008347 [Umbelopsis isabellina]|uniref:NmrA-like domain-containing protein n=1 Tax=Mortierella isabellina TaxID=91625 RepID=A0A8H7U6Q8_MORIS|nr:hypothetical protein INT43_008347 [Umbelopsis isabellina]